MGSDLKDHTEALNRLLQTLAHENVGPQAILDALAQFCVDQFGAAFARIWLADDGQTTLCLTSSRGQYTRLDGTRARIPVGQGSKIDKMYVECKPHVTNDVLNDPGVRDKEWAQREGFVSFAGYPLCWGGGKLGVLGMYSRQFLSEELLSVMGMFSFIAAAILCQQRQYERSMTKFCEVTGFKPALLTQLIKLGRSNGSITEPLGFQAK